MCCCSTRVTTGITRSLPIAESFSLPDVRYNSWLHARDPAHGGTGCSSRTPSDWRTRAQPQKDRGGTFCQRCPQLLSVAGQRRGRCSGGPRAGQLGTGRCHRESRGTRLARHQAVTKWPSINPVRKPGGLEGWRSEVLGQAPAGAVAAKPTELEMELYE